MSKELIFKKTVVIKAEKSKVWDALINPEMTKQYMYGCVPVTDWQVGSKLLWNGAEDGVTYVIGEVVKFEPESVLATTTFDPNSGHEDIPENYLTGEYALTYANGETTINITQGNFATVESGQERYDQAGGAWDMAMQALKNLLEE